MDMNEFERVVDSIGETVNGEDLLVTMAALHCVMTGLLDALVEAGQLDLHSRCCRLLVTDYQVQGWTHTQDVH